MLLFEVVLGLDAFSGWVGCLLLAALVNLCVGVSWLGWACLGVWFCVFEFLT